MRGRAWALALLWLTAQAAATEQDRIVLDLPLPPASSLRAPVPSTAPRLVPASMSVLSSPDAPATEPSSDTGASGPRQLILEIQPGQSLYHLFSSHGLSRADLVTMVRRDRRLKARLRRLQPGQRIAVEASSDGSVQRLVLQTPGPEDLLVERREGAGFSMRTVRDEPFADAAAAAPVQARGTAAPAAASMDAATAAQATTPDTTASSPAPVQSTVFAPTDARTDSVEPPASPDSEQTVTVQRGDSLYSIFRRLGVSTTDLANLMAADKKAGNLRRLRPGQEVSLGLSAEGRLDTLSVEIDETRTLRARRTGDAFSVEVEHDPLQRRAATGNAVIEDSLFLAGQRVGLSDRVIMQMVEIFGWDVDFALDVRAGDRFTVVYEELFKDGAKVRDGQILAAEFVNRGRAVRAIRYVDPSGHAAYFSPDGLSMRKAFLRTPVNFSRISSRFSSGRMHPVLQRMRAHKGVDYAAPTGTPVRSAGDGRVTFAGWKGGYGKTIIVQHGATYTTLYGHLSRIHRNARAGARVQQGDVIGYVGQTGLATGPHLHYEFRVRDVHQDPLRVKLPKALPIEARYKNDFLSRSRPLVAQLDALARTAVASTD